LHITARRADGYHELQTVFQFLDYCDELHCQLRQDGQIYCHSDLDLPPQHNLIIKAARLLQQHSRTQFGADIWLHKRIPLGGGLGGGSSNAATTLLALNNLWQLQYELIDLRNLAVTLGADVPIFLFGQAAWAEGIGEKLTPIILEEYWVIIIYPGCSVATAQIFSDPLLTRNQHPITMGDFLMGQSSNICTPVVRHHYPAVAQALDWLQQFGNAKMTGTGSCIFMLCDNPHQAQNILTQLPAQWSGFVTQTKNNSPLLMQISAN
jgi:4-diphosphocytidyl-2-C-methyl-D-erythritol kinase